MQNHEDQTAKVNGNEDQMAKTNDVKEQMYEIEVILNLFLTEKVKVQSELTEVNRLIDQQIQRLGYDPVSFKSMDLEVIIHDLRSVRSVKYQELSQLNNSILGAEQFYIQLHESCEMEVQA